LSPTADSLLANGPGNSTFQILDPDTGRILATNYADVVKEFVLINGDTGDPIAPLNDGDTLDLATLPTQNLKIRANTNPSSIGSMVFDFNGVLNIQIDDSAPYDFTNWTPTSDSYTLTATPYSEPGGSGTSGVPLTIAFTIVDTSVNCDTVIPAGDVTGLIGAINTANGNGVADTLCLSEGTYTFTAADNTTYGGNALPSITSEITLVGLGNGATLTRDPAAPNFRILLVDAAGSLTLENLTVSGGIAGGTFDGGGIRNYGTLTILDSTITGNAVETSCNGGGVMNFGTATFTNSTISYNTAQYGGGLFVASGSVTLSGVQIEGNTASYIGGGIYLYNYATLDIRDNSLFTDNDGGVYGGGVANNSHGTLAILDSTLSGNHASFGGALYAQTGTTTLTNSILTGNSAGYGAGIEVAANGNVTLIGTQVVSNSADAWGGGISSLGILQVTADSLIANNTSGDDGGGLHIHGSSATLDGARVEGNSAVRYGGGIYNSILPLTITNTTITGNSAVNGGGFYTSAVGGVSYNGATFTASTLSDNIATGDGGGIYSVGTVVVEAGSTISGNQAGNLGGGIKNTGTLTVRDTTLTGNTAQGDGGGIHNTTAMTVTGSVFSNNLSSANGGGVYNNNRDSTVHTSCISGNSAVAGGGVYSATSRMGASDNWWGAADGPSGSGPGTGDAVNSRVVFNPFITSGCPAGAGAMTLSVEGRSATRLETGAITESAPVETTEESAAAPPVIR